MNAPTKTHVPAGIIARAQRIQEAEGREAALRYYRWHIAYYLTPERPQWPPELVQIIGDIFLTEGADAAEEYLAVTHPHLDRSHPLERLQSTAALLGYPIPWLGLGDG